MDPEPLLDGPHADSLVETGLKEGLERGNSHVHQFDKGLQVLENKPR
jgi:hypothetical protein